MIRTDDFERAELGANWAALVGWPIGAISSGKFVASNGGAYWAADTFGAKQYSEITLYQPGGAVNDCGVFCRANLVTGEALFAPIWNAGDGCKIHLYRRTPDGGGGFNYTDIATAFAVTVQTGDKLRIVADGASVKVQYNEEDVQEVGDLTYCLSGALGVYNCYDNLASFFHPEAWEGGDLPGDDPLTVVHRRIVTRGRR